MIRSWAVAVVAALMTMPLVSGPAVAEGAAAPAATVAPRTGVVAPRAQAVRASAWLDGHWVVKAPQWEIDGTILVQGLVEVQRPDGLWTSAPAGRRVVLQHRVRGSWVQAGVSRTDAMRIAHFSVAAPSAGVFRIATAGAVSTAFAVRRVGAGYVALNAEWSFPSYEVNPPPPGLELRAVVLASSRALAARQPLLLQRHGPGGWTTVATRSVVAAVGRIAGYSTKFWAPVRPGTYRLVLPKRGLSLTHVYGRPS